MKCDICHRDAPPEELTAMAVADSQGVYADDWNVCDSCFVGGVAEGSVHLNAKALEPQDDDSEGEEWKG